MARNLIGTTAALALTLSLTASCVSPTDPPDIDCPPVAAEPAMEETPVSTLAALRATAEAAGVVRVIARIAGAGDIAQPAMEERQEEALAAFAAAGVAEAQALNDRLPYVVADLTPEQLDVMYANPAFDAWSEDRLAFPTLADSVPLVQGPQLFAAGGRGQGQAVAILDTGVDSAHSFLAGRVTAEACFSTTSALQGSTSACPNGQASQVGAGAGRPCNADGCEHGTHVAGIAAGRGASFTGMAPDAEIIAVQVFSVFRGGACGGGASPCVASFTSDQIRALDFVLQQAQARAVASVNMSLGGGRSTGFCDADLTKPIIEQLRAAGVATVIASGNDGFRNAVSFPGCISSAITVGATSKADAVASFSNCGPQVDLHAPGVSINSSTPNNTFSAFSGTSMATPHVAGAFAALRSFAPNASVSDIETALESTGVNTGGRPRIKVFDASARLSPGAPAP